MKGAGFVASVYEPELGKFKVPTLRNVDKRPIGKNTVVLNQIYPI